MSKRILAAGVIALAAATLASAQSGDEGLPTPALSGLQPVAPSGGRLRIGPDRRIRDALGGEVVLRGVNVGTKGGDFLPPHGDADVAALVRATGVNFIRLYVSWRAIEPQPNTYDADYLDGIVRHVERWNAQGVYVLVDMHQDLWGGTFAGNGAPEWATLGRPGAAIDLPADLPWQARYADPEVWSSFEALWSNHPVPATGKGLQDHLAGAWCAVAKRLKGRAGVVGYDLLNEPFFGAEVGRELRGIVLRSLRPAARAGARAAGEGLARALREHLASRLRSPFSIPSPGRVVAEGRRGVEAGFARGLRDPKVFKGLLAALAQPTERFAQRLSRFYTRVGGAVQAVDPEALIFVEPMALAGIGVPSRMPRPRLENLVYAPHLYDAFVDSGSHWDGTTDRVKDALLAHRQEAKRLGAPLVIGEWGNAHRDPAHQGFLKAMTRVLNASGVGAAYWDHTPGEEQSLALALALGPYPRRVAGTLRTFSFRPGRFVVIYKPDGTGQSTLLSLPRRFFPQGVRVTTPTRVQADWHFDPVRSELRVRCQPKGAGVMIVVVEPGAAETPVQGSLNALPR